MRLREVDKLKYGQQVTVCQWRKGVPGVRRQTIISNWRQEYIGTVVKTTPKGGILVKGPRGEQWEPYSAVMPNDCEVQEHRWRG